jgi:hypothetical protein
MKARKNKWVDMPVKINVYKCRDYAYDVYQKINHKKFLSYSIEYRINFVSEKNYQFFVFESKHSNEL